MAQLKNTIINSTGDLKLPNITTASRSVINNSYTVQIFTTTPAGGTWTVPSGVTEVDVLVVAGGGGGGSPGGGVPYTGGGGGAGGVIFRKNFAVTPASAITVTVGSGGSGSDTGGSAATNGGNSVFGSLTAIGGGAGGNRINTAGGVGGSGGGASSPTIPFLNGSAGTAGQGYAGGKGWQGGNSAGGGGGGAGGPGTNGTNAVASGGGPGLWFDISGSMLAYGGGGGGSTEGSQQSMGGVGGGGSGGGGQNGRSGDANTGGGGGAGQRGVYSGGNGGSGIVIIRYISSSNNQVENQGLISFNREINDLEIYEGKSVENISINAGINFAGHNLYPQRVDLTANWTSLVAVTITATTETTAPDETLTAYKFVETAATDQHFAYISQGYTAGRIYCQSIYVKPINRRYVALAHASRVVFDLQTGAINSSQDAGFVNGGIKNVGNGWYRIWSATVANSVTSYVFIYPDNWAGETVPNYAGNVNNGFYIWGHQLEEGVTTPGPWTPTRGAATEAPYVLDGYRIHRYLQTGKSSFSPAFTGAVEVLVVGGGGSGSDYGGGGAGGVIYQNAYRVQANKIYNVVVGQGGLGISIGIGNSGSSSVFDQLLAFGGGGGGSDNGGDTAPPGRPGGSGGGGGGRGNGGPFTGGEGVVGQGHRGGIGSTGNYPGGGGGGAGGAGGNGNGVNTGGNGGIGLLIDITGQPTYYGGGGGGGVYYGGTGGLGGLGGGGRGATIGSGNTAGTANTGGGGGGRGTTGPSSDGGSGIVVVRYRVR